MNSIDTSTLIAVATLGGTILIAVWSAAIWLSRQFNGVKNFASDIKDSINLRMDLGIKQIIDKLEYHETHDDQRFANMGNDIWLIKLRNASKDGVSLTDKK